MKDINLKVGIVIEAMRKNNITQEDIVVRKERPKSQLCGYPHLMSN